MNNENLSEKLCVVSTPNRRGKSWVEPAYMKSQELIHDDIYIPIWFDKAQLYVPPITDKIKRFNHMCCEMGIHPDKTIYSVWQKGIVVACFDNSNMAYNHMLLMAMNERLFGENI